MNSHFFTSQLISCVAPLCFQILATTQVFSLYRLNRQRFPSGILFKVLFIQQSSLVFFIFFNNHRIILQNKILSKVFFSLENNTSINILYQFGLQSLKFINSNAWKYIFNLDKKKVKAREREKEYKRNY